MMAVCEKIQCVWGRFAKLLVDGDSFSRRTEKQKKNTVRARSFVDCGIGEYGRSRANKNKKGKKKKKKKASRTIVCLGVRCRFHWAFIPQIEKRGRACCAASCSVVTLDLTWRSAARPALRERLPAED